MRKSNKEAAKTRERIVAAAARSFRENGIVGAGLSRVMGAAGLTHGGFYKHFASKEEVVAEALDHIARTGLAKVAAAAASAPEGERAVAFIDAYLSVAHRDDPGGGCGFAALGPEIAREGPAARAANGERYRAFVDAFAATHPGFAGPAGRSRAQACVATMIGAMICARAVGDPALSDAVLESARDALVASLGAATGQGGGA